MPGTILITGCKRGIGLAMTRKFVEGGRQVVSPLLQSVSDQGC